MRAALVVVEQPYLGDVLHLLNRLEQVRIEHFRAVLCAAGYNIQWLLRQIAKKGVAFLRRLYLRLCEAAKVRPNWLQTLRTWLEFTPHRLASSADRA